MNNALPEGLVIRRAEPADKPAVAAQQIDSQNEEARLHPSREVGQKIAGVAWDMIHQRGGCMLIAEDNGKLIGHIGGAITRDASPFFNAAWQEYAMIFDLYVAPSHRRLGIGRLLVKAIMLFLKNAGARRFRIVGLIGNDIALALYRDMGFTDYEVTLERNDA